MPSAAPGSIQPMIQPSQVLRNDQTLITSCTISTGSSSAAAVAGGSTNAAKGVASAPTPASPPFAMPSNTTATTRIASVAGSANMLMRRGSCVGIVGQAPVDRTAPVRLQKRVRLAERPRPEKTIVRRQRRDRKSVVSGKSVSVRVDLGGRRLIKKKKTTKQQIKLRKPNR